MHRARSLRALVRLVGSAAPQLGLQSLPAELARAAAACSLDGLAHQLQPCACFASEAQPEPEEASVRLWWGGKPAASLVLAGAAAATARCAARHHIALGHQQLRPAPNPLSTVP